MKYIKKIILENFQSHKNTIIELSDGLNVIVGPSDSGKTAIIRGILWILFDTPRNDSIIRAGERFTTVQIIMKDGSFVKKTRELNKSPAITTIIYDAKSDKEETYAGNAKDLKDKISEILGIPTDESGRESYNIHDQLSAPFLLGENNNVKAQAIGKLVGVDIIDDATSDTNTDITIKKRDIKKTETEIDEIDTHLKSFDDLEEKEIAIRNKSELVKKLEGKITLLNRLSELIIKSNSIKSEKTDTVRNLNYYETILKYENIALKIDASIADYNNRVRLYDIYKNNRFEKENIEIYLRKTVSLEEIIGNFENLSEKHGDFSLRKPLLREFLQNKKDIANTQLILSHNRYSIERENEINEINIMNERFLRLLTLKKNLEATNSETFNCRKKIDSYKNFTSSEPLLKESEEILLKLDKISRLGKTFYELSSRILKGKQYLQDNETELKKKSEEYVELLRESKICPTCLRPLKEEELKNIMREYEV